MKAARVNDRGYVLGYSDSQIHPLRFNFDEDGNPIPKGDLVPLTDDEWRALIPKGGDARISYDGETVTFLDPEPLSEEEQAQRHRARIAATRYEHETAGIVIDGYRVPTDDRSKSLLAGKALRATRDPDLTYQWKTPDGWKTLDADAVLAIAEAVDDHVQACFDREKELLDKLDAGEFDESMLEEGWPE